MTISLSLKLHLWLGAFITIHFVFLAFSDNLLAQNHSYNLCISVFVLVCFGCEFAASEHFFRKMNKCWWIVECLGLNPY